MLDVIVVSLLFSSQFFAASWPQFIVTRTILTTMRIRSLAIVVGVSVALFPLSDALAAKRLSSRTVSVRVSERRMKKCDEVGLCKKGQKRLLLSGKNANMPAALKAAFSKGCTVTRSTKQRVGIVCPAAVTVATATEERVFQMQDLFAGQQIGATTAYQRGFAGAGILAAVLDTGVDANHPELLGRVSIVQDFTSSSLTDTIGHGTHVSGIVAGAGNITDALGNRAQGVSPFADLIVGKVCNDQGYCLEGDIIAGIEWAVQRHARVINLSLGGGPSMTDCDGDTLAQMVNWAADQGTVVVAAAGNGGASDAGVAVPGCASKAIAVGAVDRNNVRAPWSSYGPPLDVMAPGVSILSPVPCSAAGTCADGGGYAQWSGTSMAAPQVTGAVALLLQADPTLTPARILTLLRETATDVGTPGFDDLNGYGVVNVTAALNRLQQQQSSSSSSAQSSSSAAASQSSSSSSVSSESSSSDSGSSESSWSSESSSESSWSSESSNSQSTSSDSSSNSSVEDSSSSSSTSEQSSSSSSSSSSSRSSRDHEDEDSDDESEDDSDGDRQKPPRDCKQSDWSCTDFRQCRAPEKATRVCILINRSCLNPDAVHPEEAIECAVRRDWRKAWRNWWRR